MLNDKCHLFPYRPSNYTLGVGSNKMSLHVVDVTHTEPWIINSYNVHITRREPAGQHGNTRQEGDLQACTLAQVES